MTPVLPGLVGVGDPDRVVGDVDHVGVLDLVDGVAADVGHLPPLGDQDYIIALQEADEAWRERTRHPTNPKLNFIDIAHFIHKGNTACFT